LRIVIVIPATTTLVLVLNARLFEVLSSPSLIVHGWWNAVQLQSDAGRTRPCIGGCCVALDLPSPTSFAGSHNYLRIRYGYSREIGKIPTLEPLVAVVLVDEDIVYMIVSPNCPSIERHQRRKRASHRNCILF
jgi:hypothetical protein